MRKNDETLLLPQNIEAEQRVLGSLLLDSGEGDTFPKVMEILQAEHFYKPSHRFIYTAAITLFKDKVPVDILTVIEALKKMSKYEEAGGAEYVARLSDDVSSSRRVTTYANMVREAALKRSLIDTSNAIIERALSDGEDSEILLQDSGRVIKEVASRFAKASDWPTLAAEAFHGIAGEIVHATDPYSEADLAATLVSFLVGFGNLIGPNPHFLVGDKAHSLRIFPVLVGETSKGRKGTSWATPKRLLCEADPEWTSQIKSGLSSGEGLIYHVRDEKRGLVPIKEKGRIIDYEEAILDEGVEDKRLLVVEEEFASALKVMGRDGSTLSPIIRQAWDDGSLATLTKNSPIQATGAHISIIGHITREELLRFITATEQGNGFANRFLWVLVRRSKIIPTPQGIPDHEISRLASAIREASQFARGIGKLERSIEAEEIWCRVYPSLSEGKPGLFGAVTGRAEAQVMRLACIYAVLDRSGEVRPDHLKAALAVWDYAEASALLIFDKKSGNPLDDKIFAKVRERGALTETEIHSALGRNRAAVDVKDSLERLQAEGQIEQHQEETGGRPRTIWSSNA
jgi:hypothetical protein